MVGGGAGKTTSQNLKQIILCNHSQKCRKAQTHIQILRRRNAGGTENNIDFEIKKKYTC